MKKLAELLANLQNSFPSLPDLEGIVNKVLRLEAHRGLDVELALNAIAKHHVDLPPAEVVGLQLDFMRRYVAPSESANKKREPSPSRQLASAGKNKDADEPGAELLSLEEGDAAAKGACRQLLQDESVQFDEESKALVAVRQVACEVLMLVGDVAPGESLPEDVQVLFDSVVKSDGNLNVNGFTKLMNDRGISFTNKPVARAFEILRRAFEPIRNGIRSQIEPQLEVHENNQTDRLNDLDGSDGDEEEDSQAISFRD